MKKAYLISQRLEELTGADGAVRSPGAGHTVSGS